MHAAPPEPPSRSRFEHAAPWLLAALALAAYAPALLNELTNWDDNTYVHESPFVKAGWSGVWLAFTHFYDGAYLPVTHALLALVTAAFGEQALPLHALQWLLFGVTVGLLPGALAVVGVPWRAALVATALWACHPFRVESVVWTASLKDVVSALGLVLAVRAYGAGRRAGSAALFTVGLLAKPTIGPAALLFVWLEWRRGGKAGLLRAVSWVGPAVASSAVAVQAHFLNPSQLRAPFAPWTPVVTPVWYLARLLWPDAPRAVYAWQAPSFPSAWTWAALAFWAALAVGLVLLRRTRVFGAALALVAWYLGFLAPLSGVVPVAYPVAERYTLWPSLSLALGLGLGLARLPWRWALGATAAGVAALLAVAVPRVFEWRTSLTLWEANLKVAPDVFTVRYNYAGALGGVGRFDDAYLQLQTARGLAPRWPGIDCQLAMARAGRDKVDPAWTLDVLPQLCRAKPDEKWAAAKALLRQRDPRARLVIEELDMGEHRAPSAAAAGALALQQGDLAHAEILARLARQWDPTLEGAAVTLALSLVQQKRLDEALAVTDSAFRDAKVAAQLMGVRAVVLNAQGKTDEAAKLLEQSVARLRALGEAVPVP